MPFKAGAAAHKPLYNALFNVLYSRSLNLYKRLFECLYQAFQNRISCESYTQELGLTSYHLRLLPWPGGATDLPAAVSGDEALALFLLTEVLL